MQKIGLLSDTHNFFDDALRNFFKDVDVLWHAGDIGSVELLDELRKFKPTIAVYGNIDSVDLRAELNEFEDFLCEEVRVIMTHIGGFPGKYEKKLKKLLSTNSYNLVITGHSHILKILYDKTNEHLHMNPGACGQVGFHQYRTAVRFIVNKNKFEMLEVWEKER